MISKTVKRFLSDKATSIQKVTLTDNDKIKKINDTVRVLNTLFWISNIVSDHKITDYNSCDPLVENIQEPDLKAIVEYQNHPNIFTIE